jgi:hypothetical protein
MRLSEVRESPHSAAIGYFYRCRHCLFIDRDTRRFGVGFPCPNCGVPGRGARLAYPMSILDLLDMMQAAYVLPSGLQFEGQSLDPNGEDGVRPYEWGEAHGVVAVVLYFCTLREVLMTNLLDALCDAHQIPDQIADKLMKDHRLYMQKQGDLLPVLVGVKWKAMLRALGDSGHAGLEELDALVESAAKARNEFIHEGRQGASLSRAMATQCVDAGPALLRLYTALNNAYVCPLVAARGRDTPKDS